MNNFYLIIFTAIFSSFSLITDQAVFQIEKKIIDKEFEVTKYQDDIVHTRINFLHFYGHYQSLSIQTELIVKGADVLKEDNLNMIFEEFKPVSNYTNLDYLLRDNYNLVKEKKEKLDSFLTNGNEILLNKIDKLRNYFYEVSNIHLDDMSNSESYLIKKGESINGLRALRQLLIVLAFSLNISALMSLLYYFKNTIKSRLMKMNTNKKLENGAR